MLFRCRHFVASVLARHEKGYSAKELIGIGAIAAILTAGGLALMVWSGFLINLYGVSIQGIYWALIGIVTAIVAARKKDAL